MRAALRQRTSALRSDRSTSEEPYDPVAAPFLDEASDDAEPTISDEATSAGGSKCEQEQPAADKSADPVVGSVLAQFAKLENK